MFERVVAVEEMTSGYCNMDCKYCYIPKAHEMKNLHEDICASIKSGEHIKKLKSMMGEQLEVLGLWGTEPTLTLDLIADKLEQYFEEFPKLNRIGFSTNMYSNTESIHRLIDKLEKITKGREKRFCLDFQISLDGPGFITDKNRKDGAAGRIVDNFKRLIDHAVKNSSAFDIRIGFKPTISIDNIKEFIADRKVFESYYAFFDDILDYYHSCGAPKNILLGHCVSSTMVVPGKYTSEDGKLFAEYVSCLYTFNRWVLENKPYKHIKGNLFDYCFRLSNIIRNINEIHTKHSMFTCSAGDSCVAMDNSGNTHICHRTF